VDKKMIIIIDTANNLILNKDVSYLVISDILKMKELKGYNRKELVLYDTITKGKYEL